VLLDRISLEQAEFWKRCSEKKVLDMGFVGCQELLNFCGVTYGHYMKYTRGTAEVQHFTEMPKQLAILVKNSYREGDNVIQAIQSSFLASETIPDYELPIDDHQLKLSLALGITKAKAQKIPQIIALEKSFLV